MSLQDRPHAGALDAAEALLLDLYGGDSEPAAVFILGAPRTGSTLLYQAMAAALRLPYVSNFTSQHFAANPILGIAIQNGIRIDIAFQSSYGKTVGAFQPSEGSAVMASWFGGGHPSQLVSTRILDGREPHFKRTLAAVASMCGAPLLVKNAWHCFRVAYLARALPQARFVWIRRDIRDAAHSDLEARVATKGDRNAWNSATPANVEELRKLPPHAQVVENQLEFSRAVEMALRAEAGARWLEVWYEDLVAEPSAVLARIGNLIGRAPVALAEVPGVPVGRRRQLDEAAVRDYVAANRERLEGQLYRGRGER